MCLHLFLKILIFIYLGLGLSACANLESNETKPQIYRLVPQSLNEHKNHVQLNQAQLDIENTNLISIDVVHIPPYLETSGIMLLKHHHIIDHYADARWESNTDNMIERFMQTQLEHYYGPVIVTSDDPRIKPDYTIQLDIRDFYADYQDNLENAPDIKFKLVMRIIKTDHVGVIGQYILSGQQQAQKNTLKDVVHAFNLATDNVGNQLLNKVKESHILAERASENTHKNEKLSSH